MRTPRWLGIGFCVTICSVLAAGKKSKYSADANVPNYADDLGDPKDYAKLDSPFRMQKVNMLWHKAKNRLPENKLKVLYVDLKSQDKDELLLKKTKSEGQDKSGAKESAVRKQLTAIVRKYGLSDPWQEPENNETADGVASDPAADYARKQVFRDKKLNKLWSKAEETGLDHLELRTLREEFQHHQDKIDQYYMLMDRVNRPPGRGDRQPNSLDAFLDEEERKPKTPSPSTHQMLKEKHRDLKDGYEKLAGKVHGEDAGRKEFEEYAVQSLWDLATRADFTPAELNSLRSELHHYENRIRKLRFFQNELDAGDSGGHGKNKVLQEKPADQKHLFKKVKEFEYKVSKIHSELEGRIMQRHSEL